MVINAAEETNLAVRQANFSLAILAKKPQIQNIEDLDVILGKANPSNPVVLLKHDYTDKEKGQGIRWYVWIYTGLEDDFEGFVPFIEVHPAKDTPKKVKLSRAKYNINAPDYQVELYEPIDPQAMDIYIRKAYAKPTKAVSPSDN